MQCKKCYHFLSFSSSSFICACKDPSGERSKPQAEQHFWSLVEAVGQAQAAERLKGAGGVGGGGLHWALCREWLFLSRVVQGG